MPHRRGLPLYGNRCPEDFPRALALHRRAADYGLPEALYRFGTLYQTKTYPRDPAVRVPQVV